MAVSCSKTTFLEAPEAAEIRFENAFVSRLTKAEITSSSLTSFNAFCKTADNETLLSGDEVSRETGTWEYSDPCYWDYGQSYAFAAYAPSEAADAVSNVVHDWDGLTFDYNSDEEHQYDLVLANKVCSQTKAVELDFKHLMSIVYFVFRSEENNDITFNLNSLNVSGIYTEAHFNGETFTGHKTPGTYSILPESGATCTCREELATKEIYVIPQSHEDGRVRMELNLNATDNFGNVLTYNDSLKITLPEIEWEANSTYIITTDLNVHMVNPNIKVSKIEFSVEVEDWETQE